MTAKLRLRLGPVSAAFGGNVTLSDIDRPNGYRISGEGQGVVAGFAKGGAVVRRNSPERFATACALPTKVWSQFEIDPAHLCRPMEGNGTFTIIKSPSGSLSRRCDHGD